MNFCLGIRISVVGCQTIVDRRIRLGVEKFHLQQYQASSTLRQSGRYVSPCSSVQASCSLAIRHSGRQSNTFVIQQRDVRQLEFCVELLQSVVLPHENVFIGKST